MKLTGSELLIKLLENQDIDVIAGIPGGANLPIYDALYSSNIKHILCKHEQGAGFLAHGISRTTGKASVCFATSGPGATNVISAIADAKLDSIPVVFITGQVSSSFIGTDAFQEVDTYGITIPITKHNFLIRHISELLTVIPEAFTLAVSGRPGPVVVDIPKDIQLSTIEIDTLPVKGDKKPFEQPDKTLLSKAAATINKAKKPLLYIGGGIIHSEAHHELIAFAEKGNIPVTTTLLGLGSIPVDHRLNIGMLGMHGARYTNFIVEEADLLITIGARFDDRATGNIKKFAPNASIVHIDIDEAEIDKNRKSDVYVIGDSKDCIIELIKLVEENPRPEWLAEIAQLKSEYPFIMPSKEDYFKPLNIIKTISELVEDDTIITTDVGQHQMWVAQGYPFKKPKTLLTSGGLGTMGFGMPAAIGAAIANPDKRVICFTGDGSILMNIQELATLAELNLDVKIFIMNNGHLGLVRQQQELFYKKQFIACKFDLQLDFIKIAEGFGLKGVNLDENTNPSDQLKEIFATKDPCVINVPIHFSENVFPMVPPGASNKEMLGGEL